jgi:hypothetical protein
MRRKPDPIEQAGHQIGHAAEVRQHCLDFLAGKDRGQLAGAFGAFEVLQIGKRLL